MGTQPLSGPAVTELPNALATNMTLFPRGARVYEDYGSVTPPHPGNGWTRFVCISDTHSRMYPVPDGDFLIHSGDLSSWGRPHQLQITIDWLISLPHPAKVIIAGNHDHALYEPEIDEAQQYRPFHANTKALSKLRDSLKGNTAHQANLYYLEHQSLELVTAKGRRWKFYGSPAAPRYAWGSFQYSNAQEARVIYDCVPEDTEILLTHTPPYGVCDLTRRDKRAGCRVLAEKVKALPRCKLHAFGHIHEAHGFMITNEVGSNGGELVSVNAAVAWGGQAVIVDLPDD